MYVTLKWPTTFSLIFTGILLASSLFATSVFAAPEIAPLPHSAAVPGGVVTVDLGPAHGTAPVVHYNKKRVMVVQNDGHWQAVVGIPLSSKTGKQQLKVRGRSQAVPFEVKPKNYAEQHLTIQNKRKVNPNKEDMKRIRGERGRINAALRHWQQQDMVDTRFTLPVTGRLSSPFGLQRFFNEQPRKPHSGIDIAAPEGTPIVAPAAGRIIENGNFFFNGNSVFIDHGQGLVTLYCHMSRIDVKPGQRVARGETIGAVGQTGRATGPHLHWSVSLNDARVDPGLFFEDLDALLTPPNPVPTNEAGIAH
jgi:murein DD-endopeptidase MepM/ murein hydrolase activator NlpD